MAFEFILETGEIVPGANSYASVEEADDYLAANIHADESWSALPEESKQKLLVWSTRYIDQRARWNGKPVSATQPLRHPRHGLKNADGIEIPWNIIAPQLKAATIEMARYLVDTDRSADRPQDGLKSLKVDVIELEFREGYSLPSVPQEINNMLAGLGSLISGPGGHAKIRRA
ncbi:hypothetical protein HNR26_003869 [Rhizobium rosettiformans]|uniref:Putative DnaT-like domain-containing protein n=2 Tax=Rhizobium rosettiformans TaxID=1368430 RepID=A0A4S8PRT7_9HYPH|nr:DnaT-like ssDNA-binding protein [Rhizobium rosettiformans]MBB5277780.1 hypothetical protein [Rhizobium rosettiformans]THV32941.1 hypothetical protein FAA86_18800 [Rhizobium rosettiformans W3]